MFEQTWLGCNKDQVLEATAYIYIFVIVYSRNKMVKIKCWLLLPSITFAVVATALCIYTACPRNPAYRRTACILSAVQRIPSASHTCTASSRALRTI